MTGHSTGRSVDIAALGLERIATGGNNDRRSDRLLSRRREILLPILTYGLSESLLRQDTGSLPLVNGHHDHEDVLVKILHADVFDSGNQEQHILGREFLRVQQRPAQRGPGLRSACGAPFSRPRGFRDSLNRAEPARD